MTNRLAFQDRELREAGAIKQSAETAAEVRAHSVATAERQYAAHGRRERLLAYTAQYRAVIMVRRSEHNSKPVYKCQTQIDGTQTPKPISPSGGWSFTKLID